MVLFSVINRDGNCLFNAISFVLFGHENASSEIRLKTFFELFDNAAFYERIHVKYFIPDVSPPLASAIRQCDPVLKATIASFAQSCQTESNSIESEHVMESIIDSESTSHVSEEAPIDSFVQLPETESDCHQSDHVMEFHLDV